MDPARTAPIYGYSGQQLGPLGERAAVARQSGTTYPNQIAQLQQQQAAVLQQAQQQQALQLQQQLLSQRQLQSALEQQLQQGAITGLGPQAGGPAAGQPGQPWRAQPGSADDPTMEAFVSRTLYMKYLSPSMTEERITQLCETHGGDVRRITVQPGKNIAFVEFHDIRAAEKARVALKGLLPADGEKPLEVQYSRSREDRGSAKDGGPPIKATLYVRPSTSDRFFTDPNTADDYKTLFSGYGEVKKVNINRKREAEKFIEFYDLRAAESALKALNGHNFNGVQLEVQYAHFASKTLNRDSKIHDLLVAQSRNKYNSPTAVEGNTAGGYSPVRAHQSGRSVQGSPAGTNWGAGHPYDLAHLAATPQASQAQQGGPWSDAQVYQQYATALQQQMLVNAALQMGKPMGPAPGSLVATGRGGYQGGKSPYARRKPAEGSPPLTGANQTPVKLPGTSGEEPSESNGMNSSAAAVAAVAAAMAQATNNGGQQVEIPGATE